MKYSIHDKVLKALKQAENHNSNVMVKPEVILWPDPENQWCDVIEGKIHRIAKCYLYREASVLRRFIC